MNTTQIWICYKNQLTDGHYIRVEVIYANKPSSIIIFQYKGNYLAYLNLCVHMPRTLDCEKDIIFDDTGENLRCSMHGITYDPITGKSQSEICKGEKLTPIKIIEDNENIWIVDKRVKLLTASNQ